ncbi:MAG TPA: class I SAM-dependent methyltransferase [Conexibacter sp.]|nr:class I SAM-dependent methyltransferase [Conexibacter sp.]
MKARRFNVAAALRAGITPPSDPQPSAPEPPPAADPIAAAIATLERLAPIELQRRGFHLQRRDYYSALNDLDFLAANPDLWHNRPLPAGVRWDFAAQLAFVREVAPYAAELSDVPWDAPAGRPAYYWNNDFWRGIDALVHYGLLRQLKPRRVVEIGCGWSSLLLARALERNAVEGTTAKVHQIEPYPREELLAALPGGWTREIAMLQRAALAPFEALEDGDVVFYDGSHVARAGSDVNWFFFEVMPRLAPGVVAHVHDVYWPADYPDHWIFERGQTWNEQYMLQAFLMYNDNFELLVANSALRAYHRDELEQMYAGARDGIGGGGSVWLRRTVAQDPYGPST